MAAGAFCSARGCAFFSALVTWATGSRETAGAADGDAAARAVSGASAVPSWAGAACTDTVVARARPEKAATAATVRALPVKKEPMPFEEVRSRAMRGSGAFCWVEQIHRNIAEGSTSRSPRKPRLDR
ncbi:hypothetical protein AS188_15210 [Kocuria flava]|uniref:Secreted protein n=1 Tax=Kocuria flava TaxID=446860 RepID=A0A0U3HD41_9MICC|nr:hypothetical protein AS188_15210 [Kocuria flava]GEO93625.1 hypothetical protein KFL01_29310 [Kocuria flava]